MRMQERITDFVVRNSAVPRDRFLSLMLNTSELAADIGSVLDGKSAVREGLIDRLGGLRDALDCLYSLIEGKKDA